MADTLPSTATAHSMTHACLQASFMAFLHYTCEISGQSISHKRGSNHSQLARRCGLAPTQIWRVIAGSPKAGPDLCLSISKGLNLPREEVFRARGWLLREPEKVFEPDMDGRVEQLARKLDKLPF